MHVSAGGMRAGQTLLDAAAHHTASPVTEGPRPHRPELAEAAPGVTVGAIVEHDAPADLAAQTAALTVGRALYGANARAFVADAQTRGRLLDVRA